MQKYYNMWDRIVDWFGEVSERSRIIRGFNNSAKQSFIGGNAGTLLRAKITLGNSDYKHMFSKMYSGFRITAINGGIINKYECSNLAAVILDDEELVRKLLSLGFDTLQVNSNGGGGAFQWNLSDYANMGGYLA